MIAIDYILSSNEVYDLKGQDWWVNDKMCACGTHVHFFVTYYFFIKSTANLNVNKTP